MKLSGSMVWRILAALGAVFAFALGGSSSALAAPSLDVVGAVTQFVAEDEPSDESSDSADSDDPDDADDSDDSDNSDEASDEPTEEPTEAPTTSYTDPTADGSVEMPTTGTDDTAAADEASDRRPLGWALAGGGLLAAIAAIVVFRRTR